MSAPTRTAPPRRRPAEVVTRAVRRRDVVALALALAVLGATTAMAATERVPGWEQWLLERVNRWPAAFEPVLGVVMQAGALGAVAVVALAAIVLRRRRLALEVALAGTAAWAMAKVLKDLVGRGRPAAVLDRVELRFVADASFGFPSGHAAVAAAVVATASPWLPRPARTAAWAVVVLTALARVYGGVHLPLDVVGGAALGLALGAAAHLALGVPVSR